MVLPFEKEDREKYYALLDKVFDSNFWSEGEMTKRFEKEFETFTGLESKAVSNGGTGLLSIYEYIGVKGFEVIVPANTFWATAVSAKKAGAEIVYADCNRKDLCLNYEDMVKKVTDRTKAVVVVHIGGHIAFDIEKIAEFCNEKGIFLIEDCAHAHGATWKGKAAGSWGFAGSYSFYATKTMPLGEGGMVVSRNHDFLEWLGKFCNYGKSVIDGVVSYPISNGFNYRISEITAALGLVQLERLPKILEWKRSLASKYDQIFTDRIYLPDGMISGYYKYIIFDYPVSEKTGKVFNKTDFGYVIEGKEVVLPESEWVAAHHVCVPIYHGWEKADLSVEKLECYLLNKGILRETI